MLQALRTGKLDLVDYTASSQSARGPAATTWRQILSQIPTLFGRLVFLASLRDAVTGRYTHEALAGLLGAEETDRTLCHSHHQIFSQWLASGLAEQKADLDEYRQGSPNEPDYRKLVPATAREVERQLYLTDLETLQELMRYESGHAWGAPGA
jgi:hypothetical protein